MAFARLVLSRAMTDRHAAKPSASTPTPPPSASRLPASPPSPGYLPLRLRLDLPFPTNTVELASRKMARPAWVWSVPVLRLRRECATYFGVAIGRRKTFWLCLDQQTAEAVPAPDFSEAAEK